MNKPSEIHKFVCKGKIKRFRNLLSVQIIEIKSLIPLTNYRLKYLIIIQAIQINNVFIPNLKFKILAFLYLKNHKLMLGNKTIQFFKKNKSNYKKK